MQSMTDSVSTFTRELVEDLARDRYNFGAWRTFFSRACGRSLEDIRKVPARTRSLGRWAAFGAFLGVGIMLLTLIFHDLGQVLLAAALWLPWYVGIVLFVLTHLGMVDDTDGRPYSSLLLPNGLSFLRLGLASLAMWPISSASPHQVTGFVFGSFLALLALTDALDGWLARRFSMCTRMGRMLDFLADLAFVTFLAVGLFAAGVLPTTLLILLLLRYPGTLIGSLILYFARGPAPLRPTIIGKVTSAATVIVLLAIAFALLLEPSWLLEPWLVWSARILCGLIGLDILYLVRQVFAWEGSLRPTIP